MSSGGLKPPGYDGPAVPDSYSVVRPIGRGSYGEVWLAEDAVGKRVAVKIVDRDRLGHSSMREERALRLIRHRLPHHPNLVRIEHIGLDERRIYYVMELADAVPAPEPSGADTAYVPLTLADEIERRGPADASEALRIIKEILSALSCLHTNGLVHRDVKPANVIRVGGVWKLADVGLITAEDAQMTSVGTVEYQPQSGPLDRGMDLYAAGKVLYCLLTANSPRAFPSLPAALLTRERRAATAAANALVLRACDADPQRRFRSAEEFIDALDKAQRPLKPRRPVSKARRAAILATMLLPSLLIGGAMLSGRSSGAAQAPDSWRSLFDGETMSGWFCDRPDVDGTWFVQNGALTAERDRRYKTLASEEVFDYGSFRAEVIPGHDGARLGLMFGGPRGSLFVLMGDKYTWISGDKNPKIYEQPGSWRSFPGPIPPSGEPVLMEVDWGPDRCRLFINGEFLQEVPGWPKTGNLSLHIWADDTGSFREIAYRRRPGNDRLQAKNAVSIRRKIAA
jgi:serine/threonine protein kinase